MEQCAKSRKKMTKKHKTEKYAVGKWGYIFYEKRVGAKK